MSTGATTSVPSFEDMKNRMKSASNTIMNKKYFDLPDENIDNDKTKVKNDTINSNAYNFQSQVENEVKDANKEADNEDDNFKKKTKTPSFLKFLSSTTLSVIYVLMYFCSGAMFLQYSDFYSDFRMNGRFTNESPYTTKFPYVNMFSDSKNPMDENLFSRYFNWITKGLIHSFSSGRYILDQTLKFTGNTIKDSPQFVKSLVMLFAPFMVIGILLTSNIVGYFNTFIGLFENLELVNPNSEELFLLILPIFIPLVIFLLAILFSFFTVSGIVAFVQTLMLAVFFYIIPLINKDTRQATINKMLDNKYLIILTVFVFATVNAFEELDDTYGYATLGMSLAAFLVYLYMKFL